MGRWIRVDAMRQRHPEALSGGGWAMVVKQAISEICKTRDKDGTLSSQYWNAKYLAFWTNFDRERGGEVGIALGMERALDAGLIEQLDDGSIRVPDWYRYQIDRSGATLSESIRRQVISRDNGTCQYCSEQDVDSIHIDHIIPFVRGGGNELSNLVVSCEECNLNKHDKFIWTEWIPSSPTDAILARKPSDEV